MRRFMTVSKLPRLAERSHNSVVTNSWDGRAMGASRDVSEERGSPEGGQTTHRGPPPDQMSNMKHKGISHTRSHLLKEHRGLRTDRNQNYRLYRIRIEISDLF